MKKIAVVALGGNALLRESEIGTIQQQNKNSHRSCTDIINLLDSGHEIVITHGNGPQVGNIFLRNDAGFKEYKIPKMPLDICVADSQGGIGYMVERELRNVLSEKKIKKDILTIVSQVVVDKDDPAFLTPTKPVGGYFLKEEAELLARNNKWVFKEDSQKRGWRRVVASPQPKEILNKKTIKNLVSKGNIVITAGGGGVPVLRDKDNLLQGVEAVIDKDLASSLLASSIGAQKLYILTDVSKVYINFNKPNQKALDTLTIEEAQSYLDNGEFGEGSMAPKIKGAINFIKNGGEEAIITDSAKLLDTDSGTKIISTK
ncbi:MAG: carbamate kinase [Ignavibacteriales bacterium CG_4_9_14_3_um_filter_30_11]|nr:MAG: carbamate kinase [Ignavibacteriales bacterium CG_4_9_14_3_um_filter_30_11]